nr:MAG TPA: Radical SAM superfamily [Caudoviricetes sp.]
MNNIEEITLILTRKCNLKCSFCNVLVASIKRLLSSLHSNHEQ